MTEPLVVVLPHRLGKDEALRRIREGLGRAKSEFAWLLSLDEETWTGDRLNFRVSALGQRAAGSIEVYEAGVRTRSDAALVARTLRAWRAARHRAEGPADAGEEVGPRCAA